MSKIRVAVFPCGSEIGLEIHRSLKYYRHFELIGLSSIPDHGKITYKNYVGDIPYISDLNFFDQLEKVISEKNIDFIIPALDEVGYFLKKNEEKLSTIVVYPEVDISDIIKKKSTTYKKLKDQIKVPKVFDIESGALNLPVFVKPDIGYGSKGARKISKIQELRNLEKENSNLIISEFLPGNEYTVDCFSDNDSEIIFSGARKRNRIRMGISVSTTMAEDQQKFKSLANKISKELKMKGIWFFQVKEDINNELTLLEVAGRVSGSMSYFRAKGINFIAMELFRRLGNTIETNFDYKSNGILERALDTNYIIDLDFDTVFCDLDDCLILHDKFLNTALIRFLFQCINENKRLVLLTRHEKDPLSTLKKYRIEGLFHEVHHITDSSISKAKFIEEESAIFIDDSFKERQDVLQNRKISVFAPDVIDMLIKKNEF